MVEIDLTTMPAKPVAAWDQQGNALKSSGGLKTSGGILKTSGGILRSSGGILRSSGGIKREVKAEPAKQPLKRSPSFVYSWPAFVNSTTCNAITVPIKGVVQVRSTDTIRSVLWTLIKNKVECVPVYNEKIRKYSGFVDMFDIVQYISSAAGSAVNRPDFFQVFKRQAYGDVQVAKITNGTKDCNTITESSPLSAMLELTKASNLPRVPVMQRQRVVGLVSQAKIVQYLVQNLANFKVLSSRKISQLDLTGADNVYTVEESSNCVSAFVYMAEKGVRGLAVVNSEGQFVDAINNFDLKGLVHGDFFSDLRQPVLRYLSKSRILLSKENLGPVVCTQDETLAELLQKMAKERIYRVFVLDAERKPVSVISLRDILKVMHSFNHQLEQEEKQRELKEKEEQRLREEREREERNRVEMRRLWETKQQEEKQREVAQRAIDRRLLCGSGGM